MNSREFSPGGPIYFSFECTMFSTNHLPWKEKVRESSQRRQDKKRTISSHRQKCYIPMTQEDYYQPFADQGDEVTYNLIGNGKCQFEALAYLLRNVGIHRSRDTLRKGIVEYLEREPNSEDGMPLELFAAHALINVPSSKHGTGFNLRGPEQAVANLCHVKLVVMSSIGPSLHKHLALLLNLPSATLQRSIAFTIRLPERKAS